jgi:hypothetical protein
MKSFKKIIALMTIITMLMASTIVSAATEDDNPLDNATASIILSGNGDTEKLTVTGVTDSEGATKKFSDDNIKFIEIKDNT